MKERVFPLGSGEVDRYLELGVSTYFKFMQEIAARDAEEKGVGKEQTLDKGITWIISRIEVDFIKYPKYTEEIKLQTYPGDDLKIVFPRYYRILDKDNNELVKSSSIWALLNMKTRQPVANPFQNPLPSEHLDGELGLPKKVRIPDELSLVETRKVRYNDTDLNAHLNNTKYIDFITDTHDADFYSKYRIKHLAINYMKEVKDNDLLELYSNNSNPEIIVGKVNGETVFACELTYEEK